MATRGNKGKKQRQEPDGKFRRSQVLTTYGPGAMVDLLQEAVLVSGIDYWNAPTEIIGKLEIEEPRLQDRLSLKLRESGRYLAKQGAFRMPPHGDEQEPGRHRGISAIEFPTWFVCQNSICRALIGSRSLERKKNRYFHDCLRGGSECVPVRFVSACKRGHLDEFPWVWFVHNKNQGCKAPSLKMVEGPTGDFGSIVVKCEACGASRKLVDAKETEHNPMCRGRRPWLGPEGHEGQCSERQRLLIRTASNAYFSQVESALSIPTTGEDLFARFTSKWDLVQNIDSEEKCTMMASMIPGIAELFSGIPTAEILETLQNIRDDKRPEREALRTAEYKKFVNSPTFITGDLPSKEDIFYARTLETKVLQNVEQVVLVPKLREVRVQVGFTRFESASASLQGEFDIDVDTAQIGLTSGWLPAIEILGEGIFIRLNEDMLQDWERRPEVIRREKVLRNGFEIEMKDKKKAEFPGIRFYLLHSLSHLLITALSLDCGYSASAIRERIYCTLPDDKEPMAGILLSTGSPGSEGTLGGLVNEGHRIGYHLRRALQVGELCSNDPVCSMHQPTDHAERYLDGAACHGCMYIAESSCEKFNSYLDRALVVAAIGQPENLAFFELEA